MKHTHMKLRMIYLAATALVVVAGLLSRRCGWIPACVGDGLWAVMMFCLWRAAASGWKLSRVAVAALITCYAVELSQLITWPWLCAVRSTVVGHLVLGQGFLVSDMVAYTAGVAVAYVVALMCEHRGKSPSR